MVKVYSDDDFNAICEQKKKVTYLFIGVSAVYLAICIACLIYHISLPYADPMLALPKWIMYVVTVVYVAFAFPYLGIKYSRVRRYYRMLYYVSEGIKNDEQNYFVGFESCDLQKDYVDVVSCVFMTWNKKKQEWMRREAYMDAEKPLPDFSRGDLVRYITQSNFIIQYEILAKEVLEIEEIDEYYGDYEYGDEEEIPQESLDEIPQADEIEEGSEGDIE
jgi:hypothetical protein